MVEPKKKRCKVKMKEKDGKMLLSMKGYCDEKDSNKKVNREIEMDMGDF